MPDRFQRDIRVVRELTQGSFIIPGMSGLLWNAAAIRVEMEEKEGLMFKRGLFIYISCSPRVLTYHQIDRTLGEGVIVHSIFNTHTYNSHLRLKNGCPLGESENHT